MTLEAGKDVPYVFGPSKRDTFVVWAALGSFYQAPTVLLGIELFRLEQWTTAPSQSAAKTLLEKLYGRSGKKELL
jgi:hypothetical protein